MRTSNVLLLDYARLARRKYELGQKLARVEKAMELLEGQALAAMPTGEPVMAHGMTLRVREKLKVKPVHDTRSLVAAIIGSGPEYHHLLTCQFPTLIAWAASHYPTGPLAMGRGIWAQIDPTEVQHIDARRASRKGAAL